MNKNTDCNGCPSKLKVAKNTILCVETVIEPDQPVEGCPVRGKGRAVCNISPQELSEIREQYDEESKGSTYYDPKVDPFEKTKW